MSVVSLPVERIYMSIISYDYAEILAINFQGEILVKSF